MNRPHFTAIEIQAFRGLAHLKLEGLARVNLIVGKNNSGKTTVLEAIAACCHPVDAEAWFAMVRRRGLGEPRQTLAQQFPWLFPHFSGGGYSGDLHLYFEVPEHPARWHIYGQLGLIRRITDAQDENFPQELQEAVSLIPRVGLHLEPIGAPSDSSFRRRCEFEIRPGAEIPAVSSPQDVPVVTVTPTSHRAELFQIKGLASLDDARVRTGIVELLRKLDPDIDGVETVDTTGVKSAIRVWHRKIGATTIEVLGDGFRRTLTYALSLAQCRGGGVLLIDEIETAIHYSALRDVYAWLVEAAEECDVQLFVTTHSLEAVDALLDATPEKPDTVFFRLYDAGQGVQVVRLDEDRLRAVRQQLGAEVRG